MDQITEITRYDIPTIDKLVNSAYRGDSSRKGWTTEADLLQGLRTDSTALTRLLEEPASTILKYSDAQGNLCGCVYLKRENDELYLGMLTVAPELQGGGIGKMLLRAAEEKAISEGCRAIKITVITRRQELIDWYSRKGFVDTGERLPFPENSTFGIANLPLEFMVMQKHL